MESTAWLVRHCESAGQDVEAPLTRRGRGQAEQLAVALHSRSIGGLISSPYRRARESAQSLMARTGLELELDWRLREWELPWIPAAQWPHALRPIFAGHAQLPVEVEQISAARTRGLAALGDALARERSPVLVAHGKLLALLLSEIQGRDPFEAFVRSTPRISSKSTLLHQAWRCARSGMPADTLDRPGLRPQWLSRKKRAWIATS